MEKHPPMMMVENLAHEATNQMLRDLFAEFNPRRVRIVYRNSMPKGFAGLEFEREDQALAACRQRSGALVLGRPITCRMAEPRDLSWFENPKVVKRRREQSKWDQEWDRGGGGDTRRRDSGDYNPNFPTSAPPQQQMGPGGPMNQEILAHQIMNTLSSIGMGGPPPMGGPGPRMGGTGMAPPQGGPFGPPVGGPPSIGGLQPGGFGSAPSATTPRPPANTTDKEFAPDLKSIDIREHTFFFVDFNLAYGSSGIEQPIPVEIAILAFSIAAGEKASFHRFVDPGQIPRCYLADTYCNTNSVHGIPHHGFHLAEKNYRQLYNEMTNFISQFLTASTPFVSIYAKGASTKNGCFSWLSQKAGQPPLFCIVRNVEEVLEHLHEIASSPVPSSSLCSLFATDAALSLSAVSALPAKCAYHDVGAAAGATSALSTSSSSSATSSPAGATTGGQAAASAGATGSPTLSSASSSSIVQATHMCALSNVRHVAGVVLAEFNKLDVPFK
ncbi:RNA recognition motif domain containing protein [Acanthamoeba castellanii str. Neff]|uniref:RNA recognition motif domain containing protein n=1 Tax=Acanthamoeba castellanii (strain ATCC 30010 / Neff) TaxID=1257118 RepID=L8H4J4_ACACF|nr:RNA recognition motif domain containing protein [Acanthamoeba castellanii str. Neff]ELR19643.1 RNA recognition motif domain containing protein [Acanthamoeba castellanii str. Neff]